MRRSPCHRTVKHPRSPRTRSPTAPTPTRSSAPTAPTRSRSSPTTSRSRTRRAARTSSSSATTCCTASTSTTTATARPTSSTSSGSRPRSRTRTRSSTTPGPIDVARQPELQPPADLHRHRGAQEPAAPRRSATNLPSPPCNIGPRSTPELRRRSPTRRSTTLGDGIKVFAGQRLDGFYVDLGAVFDLAALRPFQNLHLIPTPADGRRQRAAGVQRAHDRDPGPDRRADPRRQDADRPRWQPKLGDRRVGLGAPAEGVAPATTTATSRVGPFVQVSRLGNPLFNEVIVPMARKDKWNAAGPRRGRRLRASTSPAGAGRRSCRCCTRASSRTWRPTTRTARDLLAILLTGIPAGIVPGFQNFTGTTQADMLRLNVAIKPPAQPEHERHPRRRPRRASRTAGACSTTS